MVLYCLAPDLVPNLEYSKRFCGGPEVVVVRLQQGLIDGLDLLILYLNNPLFTFLDFGLFFSLILFFLNNFLL